MESQKLMIYSWEQRKLGELVEIKSGWSPSNFIESADEKDCLFIKVDDLNYSERNQNNSKIKVKSESKYIKMKKNSTVFPKRGAAIMTNKVRLLTKDSYMDTNMMALEPINIDSNFLYTFIHETGLYRIADTSTIPQINNKHIEPYKIDCPSGLEQQRIGLFFKQLDNTITLHQRKLVQLKTLKQAYLQQLFLSDGEYVPKVRFANFNQDWEQRKLGELAESFEYGLNSAAISFDGENKYLRITDIDDSSNLFKQNSLTSPDTNLETSDNYLLKKGDVLFARTGASVGKTYRYQETDGKVYYCLWQDKNT